MQDDTMSPVDLLSSRLRNKTLTGTASLSPPHISTLQRSGILLHMMFSLPPQLPSQRCGFGSESLLFPRTPDPAGFRVAFEALGLDLHLGQ